MNKQVQRLGRIKHMPAANDLLEQQIGWQGKDVRLTESHCQLLRQRSAICFDSLNGTNE